MGPDAVPVIEPSVSVLSQTHLYSWTPILRFVKGLPQDSIRKTYRVGNVSGRSHSAQKPGKLMQKLIFGSSEIHDLVLDPFMGIGTVCIAAKQLRRRSIGVEINEEYCRKAAETLRGLR